MNNKFLLDIPETMNNITRLSKDLLLPTLDTDALLDLVVEIIQDKTNLETTVPAQCESIVLSDRLYSNYAFSFDEQIVFTNLLISLCFDLSDKLNSYGMYNANQLNYKFKKVVRDNEILFEKTRAESTAPPWE